MKIEVGKSYKTRDGDIEKISHIDATHPFGSTNPFIAESGRSYREDGCYMQGGQIYDADLVAEIDGNGEPVEAGGCAPPVVVHPPITVAAESLADVLPPPAGPSIAEMVAAGTIPPPPPEPLTLKVVIGSMTEIDLMRALETVAEEFIACPFNDVDPPEMRRAADWFHAKYGSARP